MAETANENRKTEERARWLGLQNSNGPHPKNCRYCWVSFSKCSHRTLERLLLLFSFGLMKKAGKRTLRSWGGHPRQFLAQLWLTGALGLGHAAIHLPWAGPRPRLYDRDVQGSQLQP